MARRLLSTSSAMIDSLFSNQNYAAAKQMMDASVVRAQALASNIANVETPGYKRVDLQADFSSQMAARVKNGTVADAPPPTVAEDKTATSTRTDGNTVSLDKELLAMSKNSVEYDALSEIVSGNLKQLRLAITGRSA